MATATGPRPAEVAAGHSTRPPADDRLPLAHRIVAELFGAPSERDFAVRYWTGDEDLPLKGVSGAFTLVLHDAGSLRRMFLPPGELTLGESFLRGDFDVLGSLEGAASLAPRIAGRLQSVQTATRVLRLLLRLPRSAAVRHAPEGFRPSLRFLGRKHARRRDAEAVRWHYDAGNDFYALWLDREQIYSCGYFPAGDESLDDAQQAKLELICRKLRLRPGESLLDIGCGWGGLIRYAVRQYGVTALGITLSEQQARLARERIRRDGLEDRCRVEVLDYRELSPNRRFDKIASVGMFEHVGASRMPAYFDAAYRVLRPRGLFLNHGIISLEAARPRSFGQRLAAVAWQRGRFVRRYVFPDGELLPLATITGAAEAAGFETRDVESLREHYAQTLRHWVRRLEANAAEATAMVGAERYRTWRLYMAASAQAFSSGRIGVVQMLLGKQDPSGTVDLPRTREDLYRPGGQSC